MLRRCAPLVVVALAVVLAACGAPAAGRGQALVGAAPVATGAAVPYPTAPPVPPTRTPAPAPTSRPTDTPTATPAVTPAARTSPATPPPSCPVTRPPNPPFAPPAPYSATAPYPHEFWYGTAALWTLLGDDGTWQRLPYYDGAYSQKVFWWRQGYNWLAEPNPPLTVTGRRLDAPAPPLVASRATNASSADIGSSMLVGVDIPTTGCWELTGRIAGATLSFVVWVAP